MICTERQPLCAAAFPVDRGFDDEIPPPSVRGEEKRKGGRRKNMNAKTMFYILKRIGLALLTVWVVITVTFFVMHAVPGGPFMSEKAISATAQAALEEKYGLDKPLLEQYGTYLKDVVTKFDFGPSL